MKGLDKSCQKCYKVNFVFLRTILSWTVSVTVYLRTVISKWLLSALLNRFKLVFGLFGEKYKCTLNVFPVQPGKNFLQPFPFNDMLRTNIYHISHVLLTYKTVPTKKEGSAHHEWSELEKFFLGKELKNKISIGHVWEMEISQ